MFIEELEALYMYQLNYKFYCMYIDIDSLFMLTL